REPQYPGEQRPCRHGHVLMELEDRRCTRLRVIAGDRLLDVGLRFDELSAVEQRRPQRAVSRVEAAGLCGVLHCREEAAGEIERDIQSPADEMACIKAMQHGRPLGAGPHALHDLQGTLEGLPGLRSRITLGADESLGEQYLHVELALLAVR